MSASTSLTSVSICREDCDGDGVGDVDNNDDDDDHDYVDDYVTTTTTMMMMTTMIMMTTSTMIMMINVIAKTMMNTVMIATNNIECAEEQSINRHHCRYCRPLCFVIIWNHFPLRV